jgi:hypothetical protein
MSMSRSTSTSTFSNSRTHTSTRVGGLLLLVLVCLSCIPSEARVLKPRLLEPMAHIDFKPIDESSALVRSAHSDTVFWTLNDSGDWARIFAIDARGQLISPPWDDHFQGLKINGASNLDWEDLAIDDEGNLLIAACGNNGNARRDLAVYVLPEPNPAAVNASHVTKRLPFYYPEQKAFPPRERNFDCEAIFFADGRLHFLTKHRSDSKTRLYRMDPPVENGEPANSARPWYLSFREDVPVALTFLGEMDLEMPVTDGKRDGIQGLVTAADWDPKGRRLVFLNYRAIWLVENVNIEDAKGNLLAGSCQWLPIEARQTEAICFDGDTLCITNEQRDMFRVHVNELFPRHDLLLGSQ